MNPTDTDSDAQWEALARYAAGESTPAEAASVQPQIQADPVLSALLPPIGRLGTLAIVDVEAALRKVGVRLDEAEVIPIEARRQERRTVAGSTMKRLAAAAALVVVGGGAVWLSTRENAPAPAVMAAQTWQTGVGETDTINLADGTRVVLGQSSRLVAVASSGTHRTVELVGVALFDVVHDDSREFRVLAGGAEIRDIGTSFTVRTQGERGVSVEVSEGSVMINDQIALKAGEAVTIDAGGAAHLKAPAPEPLAWTVGRLVFDNASFTNIAEDLRRWYGVVLIAGDSAVSERRLTSTFEGESLTEVLNIISLALDARLEMRGDTAVLYTAR